MMPWAIGGYDADDDSTLPSERRRNFSRWLQSRGSRQRPDAIHQQMSGPGNPGPAIGQISTSGPANPGLMMPNPGPEFLAPSAPRAQQEAEARPRMRHLQDQRDRNSHANDRLHSSIAQSLGIGPRQTYPSHGMPPGPVLMGPDTRPLGPGNPRHRRRIPRRPRIPLLMGPRPDPDDDTQTYHFLGPTIRSFIVPQFVDTLDPESPERFNTDYLSWHMKRNIVSDLCFFHAFVIWVAFIVTFAVINSKPKQTEVDKVVRYTQNKAIWGVGFTTLGFMVPTLFLELTRPHIMRVLMVLRDEQEMRKFGRYFTFYSIGMTRVYPILMFTMMASLYGIMVYLYRDEHAMNEILVKACAANNGTLSAVGSTVKSIANAATATIKATPTAMQGDLWVKSWPSLSGFN
ncbi:hypothetical protein TWF694_009220 [Orbilia ellipsospora]|uniref:Uncharacterized protein n=1 Tax=Orbilia ellipsospora TaxID=2528407 RepID=A0AAV9XEX6_9PEZI